MKKQRFTEEQIIGFLKQAESGAFLTAGVQDGIKRFVSYRVVQGFPLVVYVGQAEQEVLASYWRYRSSYFTVATGATALIAIVVGFAVRSRGRLDAARDALHASEAHARKKSLELEVTLEKIAHMARHDALTSLANRTLLDERVEQALARMRRQHAGFALFYLDLDRFKAVNDIHGHPAGDTLLRNVADRLSACVRETDTIARLGGDEFAILLDATDRQDDVEALARRILEAAGAPYHFGGHHAVIGISIGIAMAPSDGVNSEDLFKAADAALYRAKSKGGNAYDFFGRVPQASKMPAKLQQAV